MRSEHVVSIRPRTVLMVALVLLGVIAVVKVVLMSERVLIWIFVSVLLALALNPVGGTIQILLTHWLEHCRATGGDIEEPEAPDAGPPTPPPEPEPEPAARPRALLH